MSNTLITIYNLLAYEEYLPVLTPSEVDAAGSSPLAGSVAGLVAKIE